MSEFAYKKQKARARLNILNYVVCFTTARRWRQDHIWEASEYPKNGDLVQLVAAPVSKWFLSWYVKRVPDGHLLESVEDGEIAKWHNVSFYILDRGTVVNHPEWRWTDRQFEMCDRWIRACRTKRQMEAFLYAPDPIEFLGETGAAFRVREKKTEKFIENVSDNWRNIKVADMLEFFDRSVELFKESDTLSIQSK